MQQVKTYGAVGLEDKIIETCVLCLSYDPQCEAEREPWLSAIVDNANLQNQVIQAIGALLRDPPLEDHRDLNQRSAMLKELAVNGTFDARRLLYLSLTRLSHTANVIAADQIVALDGVDGLRFVARKFGLWLLDDPDFWVDDWLIQQLDASAGSGVALAALEREAATDSNIARYLAALRDTHEIRETSADPMDRTLFTGAQIVAHVKNDFKDQCHWFRGWGMCADSAQREIVFTALLDAHEPDHVVRLLRCFSKTGVPRFDSRLLQWIFHTDEIVQWAAVKAVASLNHPELRKAALQLLAMGDLGRTAHLLIANYEEGDMLRYAQRLEHPTDADRCHHLGGEILELCVAHPCPETLDCLLYVYEFSPCSTCRRRAVSALIASDIVPKWVLTESTFDADPETRKLAADALADSKQGRSTTG